MHRLLCGLLPIFFSKHLALAYTTATPIKHSLIKLSRPCFQSNLLMKRSFTDTTTTANDNTSSQPSSGKATFVAPLYCPPGFNIKRVRQLTQTSLLDIGSTQSSSTDVSGSDNNNGCIVYWITRDQRAHDNHSLLYAQGLGARLNLPVRVVFNLVPKYLDATLRQYGPLYILYYELLLLCVIIII